MKKLMAAILALALALCMTAALAEETPFVPTPDEDVFQMEAEELPFDPPAAETSEQKAGSEASEPDGEEKEESIESFFVEE